MNISASVRITPRVSQSINARRKNILTLESTVKKLAANFSRQIKIYPVAVNRKILTVKRLNPFERPFLAGLPEIFTPYAWAYPRARITDITENFTRNPETFTRNIQGCTLLA